MNETMVIKANLIYCPKDNKYLYHMGEDMYVMDEIDNESVAGLVLYTTNELEKIGGLEFLNGIYDENTGNEINSDDLVLKKIEINIL